MDDIKLKEAIDEIINNTFKNLEWVYNNHKEGNELKDIKSKSRLVFPSYYDEDGKATETRISEQELRFAFVEEFKKYCDANELKLFYSVETPTKRKYINFSNKQAPQESENGRSAEFDLVIFDENGDRKCLIEFKANNADEHDHWKDFVKLNNAKEGDEGVLRYFIEIIKSYTEEGENSTINSLKESKLEHNERAIFRCYALEGKSTRKKDVTKSGEDISTRFKKE